jgi:hypothetical protein
MFSMPNLQPRRKPIKPKGETSKMSEQCSKTKNCANHTLFCEICFEGSEYVAKENDYLHYAPEA